MLLLSCHTRGDLGDRSVTLRIEAEPIPLEADPDGVVRIRGSRVTLDTIVAAFHRGATAEEILQQYPSLALADIYTVIAYYLRQQEAVEIYLRQRRERAAHVRQENENRFNPIGVRERLLARRAHSIAKPDAPPGE
jgi:uncharacterized protein (DUF433 family)